MYRYCRNLKCFTRREGTHLEEKVTLSLTVLKKRFFSPSRYITSREGVVCRALLVFSKSGRETVCSLRLFLFQFIIVMVNYCVCGGCTNPSLSRHRVHRFPNEKWTVSSRSRCISAGEEMTLLMHLLQTTRWCVT